MIAETHLGIKWLTKNAVIYIIIQIENRKLNLHLKQGKGPNIHPNISIFLQNINTVRIYQEEDEVAACLDPIQGMLIEYLQMNDMDVTSPNDMVNVVSEKIQAMEIQKMKNWNHLLFVKRSCTNKVVGDVTTGRTGTLNIEKEQNAQLKRSTKTGASPWQMVFPHYISRIVSVFNAVFRIHRVICHRFSLEFRIQHTVHYAISLLLLNGVS
ncbi:hypothetical protein ACJX0J_022196 [Zea mays]